MAHVGDDMGDGLARDGHAEQLNELKAEYADWLDNGEAGGENYIDRILRLRDSAKSLRLLVDLNHLRQQRPHLARATMQRPLLHMFALREAAKDVALRHEPSFHKLLAHRELQIGYSGSLGHNHVSPRGLRSSKLRQLVCVEGIVTKCSAVRPKIVRSVHYCPKTNSHMQREYRDSTALDLGLDLGGRTKLQTGGVYPTKDQQGNLLETEYGLSLYRDNQMVTVQEMPERAPLGQLPRSVDIVCDDDLVDRVKPGDRVRIVGVYRALAGAANGAVTSGIFRTVLLANNVLVLGKDVQAVRVAPQDIGAIRELSKRPDIVQILSRSLAPSIFGHDRIKTSLVMQLLSGEEKNLANGTHLRGDINIMMVGDPSTAKSQLLRAVMHVAPLAVSTTGRGSSGVGLTAAVTTDKETGERRLEAGAMVLADRGVVCIDEFDKMSELDRVAIHEVMEQQTVTIAKAGIHASLNARCSVVAAANPVYGQYDRNRRPQENIGLPDSLLSRFDLLFVVLDQMDPDNDRAVSQHVLRAHRYRRPGADAAPEGAAGAGSGGGGGNGSDEEGENGEEELVVWERYHPMLHGANRGGEREELLCQRFLKKYLHYAKTRVHPQLTEEAREFIASAYATLRSKQDHKTLPVTARSLETLIRLATAHAKARLSSDVKEADCQSALDLLNFAFYAEGAGATAPDDSKSTGEEEDGEGDEEGGKGSGASASRGRDDGAQNDEEAATGDDRQGGGGRRVRRRLIDDRGGNEEHAKDERRRTVDETVQRMGESEGSVTLAQLLEELAPAGPAASMTEGDLRVVLQELQELNRVLVEDDVVYPIG